MIAGCGPPPSLVLELIRWLPPGSACEAIQHDAPEMLGWDMPSRLIANVSDWSQATMISAGTWGKKTPDFKREERPWVEAQKRKKSETGMAIGDLYQIFAAKAARQGR